ncbi:MFS transporter [Nonomuraea sp. NPDC059194]|uniref:MFS transporter n=1 Tax=Nonomuraea sp. NPDC059194 TaxID=3346764 RepID=UPI0036855FF2
MSAHAGRDPRRWWVLVVLCLSLMVLVIDTTVLNVAIPALMTDLGATPSDIQWIINAYVLVYAGLLLTTGNLSDRYGRRRFLVIGLALFGGASLLATMASEPWQLIAARAFMGVGGAMLMPSTLSILITTFDEDERRKAMAAWSVVATVGVIGGPTLGGFLIERFSWASVFLLNVPVAVIAIVAAYVLMPERRGPERRLDPLGVLLSTVGLTALVYVVIEAPHQGVNVPVAVLAAVTLAVFVLWERRTPHPMLPLELFRSRDFTGASFSILLMSFGIGAVMLMLTQYLQFVLGLGPTEAGLGLLPYAIAATVFNYVGVVLGQKVSNRTLIVAGMVVMAGSFVLLATTGGYWGMFASMLVMGIGGGLAGPAAYTTLMGAVPVERAGAGSALNDTVQQVGMALSIAVLGSVLAAVYTSRMPGSAPAAARESIGQAVVAGDPGIVAAARDAFSSAMSLGAWVGTVCCLLAGVTAMAMLRRTAPAAVSPTPAEDESTISA